MKRTLSLIEVVIALTLTAILLTGLFSCYRRLILSKITIDKAREELLPHLLIEARLIQIFDRLADDGLVCTDQEKLSLSFDNGVDREPEYCGNITGSLFLDERGNITFEYGSRTEILQKGVRTLAFRFYDPQKCCWKKTWKGPSLPLQAEIKLDAATYTFSLPSVDHKAVFP